MKYCMTSKVVFRSVMQSLLRPPCTQILAPEALIDVCGWGCSFGSPIKSFVQRRNSIDARKRVSSGSGTEDEARPSVRSGTQQCHLAPTTGRRTSLW